MPTDLDSRLERMALSLPAPSPDVSERARAGALAALQEALGERARGSRRRRRAWRVGGLALAAAVAIAVAVALLAPSESGGPFAPERALAAIGDEPVIHAVVENTRPHATIVDLVSGRERPEVRRTEYWYDEGRALLRIRVAIGGEVVAELVQSREGGQSDLGPLPGGEPQLEPALATFATGYREALERGKARAVGRTSVDGREAILLQISLGPPAGAATRPVQEVAIDAESYRPLRFRTRAGEDVGHWLRVVSIETVARSEGQFAPPPAAEGPRPRQQTGTDERALTPAEAATALGRPAVWPGADVGGVELSEIQLMTVTTEWSDGRQTVGHALEFQYGPGRRAGPAGEWLMVILGTSPETPTRFGGAFGPAVEPGRLYLVGVGDLDGSPPDMWFGSMEVDGLFLSLESPDRKLVLEAARSMAPIAAR